MTCKPLVLALGQLPLLGCVCFCMHWCLCHGLRTVNLVPEQALHREGSPKNETAILESLIAPELVPFLRKPKVVPRGRHIQYLFYNNPHGLTDRLIHHFRVLVLLGKYHHATVHIQGGGEQAQFWLDSRHSVEVPDSWGRYFDLRANGGNPWHDLENFMGCKNVHSGADLSELFADGVSCVNLFGHVEKEYQLHTLLEAQLDDRIPVSHYVVNAAKKFTQSYQVPQEAYGAVHIRRCDRVGANERCTDPTTIQDTLAGTHESTWVIFLYAEEGYAKTLKDHLRPLHRRLLFEDEVNLNEAFPLDNYFTYLLGKYLESEASTMVETHMCGGMQVPRKMAGGTVNGLYLMSHTDVDLEGIGEEELEEDEARSRHKAVCARQRGGIVLLKQPLYLHPEHSMRVQHPSQDPVQVHPHETSHAKPAPEKGGKEERIVQRQIRELKQQLGMEVHTAPKPAALGKQQAEQVVAKKLLASKSSTNKTKAPKTLDHPEWITHVPSGPAVQPQGRHIQYLYFDAPHGLTDRMANHFRLLVALGKFHNATVHIRGGADQPGRWLDTRHSDEVARSWGRYFDLSANNGNPFHPLQNLKGCKEVATHDMDLRRLFDDGSRCVNLLLDINGFESIEKLYTRGVDDIIPVSKFVVDAAKAFMEKNSVPKAYGSIDVRRCAKGLQNQNCTSPASIYSVVRRRDFLDTWVVFMSAEPGYAEELREYLKPLGHRLLFQGEVQINMQFPEDRYFTYLLSKYIHGKAETLLDTRECDRFGGPHIHTSRDWLGPRARGHLHYLYMHQLRGSSLDDAGEGGAFAMEEDEDSFHSGTVCARPPEGASLKSRDEEQGNVAELSSGRESAQPAKPFVPQRKRQQAQQELTDVVERQLKELQEEWQAIDSSKKTLHMTGSKPQA